MTPVSLTGARGYAPDPVFRDHRQSARLPRNDSEMTVDSFCIAGNGRGQIEPDAALEQSSNRSPELVSLRLQPT
jgi:hypothetical protein